MTPAAATSAGSTAISLLLDSLYRTDIPGFVPFIVGAQVVGWLRDDIAARLRALPQTFRFGAGSGVRLDPALDTCESRSAAIAAAVHALADAGVVTGWRNERYAVAGADADRQQPLFTIERAAARAFGITSHAVHVNGVSLTSAGPHLWIARRSASKPIDPGMLDNMIGGGVAHGSTVAGTLLKEAWEEAGLRPEQVRGAISGRRLRIRRAVPEGLQSEIIHVHDLLLPEGTAPRNQDGEVSGFHRMTYVQVIGLLNESERKMTPDASLVTLDWLDRSGLMPLPDTPQARAIFAVD